MKFYAGYWLWGLLLLPMLYALIIFYEKNRHKAFALFADTQLWPLIAPEMDPSARLRKVRVVLIVFGLSLVALARPQMGTHEEIVEVSGLDILLLLDVSNSMDSQDVVPSRLEKSKHLIRTLVNHLDGDRVGLVPFAASSYVACPLTTDLSYLLDTVQMVGPRFIQNQGTDVGSGLETALKAIERGAQENSNSGQETPSRVIILISDGEDHEAQAVQAAAALKEKGIRLFVLGVGTEKGGPIPLRDENGTAQGYKKEGSGQTVMSSFHPDFLKKIAAASDGKYWDITPGEDEVQILLHELGTLSRGDYAERRFVVYEERYQIPLFLAVVLFLLEISIPARKIVLVLFILGHTSAYAEVFKNPEPLDVYLENKKGMEAYQAGNLEEAQKKFGAAQARDPLRPELEFNQGVIQFQKEEIDAAIGSFVNSARLAYEKKNSGVMGKSLYNLGNAFAKKGNIDEAARAYLGAIHAAREAKDSELEEAARKNLQLLVSEAKKQQQKQQQEKEQKEKEKQEQQQDQKQNGNQDQAGKEKEKEKDKEKEKGQDSQNKRYNEPKKQKFESKKMSPEDADRVMSELMSKERQLQEKLQTQHGRPQIKAKDW